MLNYIKQLLITMNKNGLPVPTITDPKSGAGSISLTLVFISSIYVQIGLIGKFSKTFDIDMTSALVWFALCMSLYMYNKKISISKEKIEFENSSETEQKEN